MDVIADEHEHVGVKNRKGLYLPFGTATITISIGRLLLCGKRTSPKRWGPDAKGRVQPKTEIT